MAERSSDIRFPPFRLDQRNQCLHRGSERIELRPKTYAVLQCLLEHAGELVTKEELLAEVWPEVVVSDSALKVCIRELRRALHDEAAAPHFIATAHRRGYRFVAAVDAAPTHGATEAAVQNSVEDAEVVGRARELERLRSWASGALAGRRQLIFVTGEAGIGKTALLEAVLPSLARLGFVVARGQCLQHYGAGEPYLPVLEGFSRLGREPGRQPLVDVLARHAPTWLAQMPALRPSSGAPQAAAVGSSERMLREMAEALEACAAETPLALLLEDVHWSDPSTIALLSALARRPDRTRLLVLATYRTAGIADHPLRALKQELQAHGRCHELPLDFLKEEAVGEYLQRRFRGQQLPEELAPLVHGRSDGNPLFIVNLVDYLLDNGLLCEERTGLRLEKGARAARVPETIREMVESQIEGLSKEDQGVLEAAGVAGFEFAAVAVGADLPSSQVEARLDALARRQAFLRALSPLELPDGSSVTRFAFIHALYEQILYERVPPARRADLHRRAGERLEGAYADQARIIAAELAMHFEYGGQPQRAASYLRQAAENAQRRFAPSEASKLAARGLRLLQRVPESPPRLELELQLQLARGVSLLASEGYAAAEVERTFARALELSKQLGRDQLGAPILGGLWGFYLLRAELARARELSDELLRLAEAQPDPLRAIHARFTALVTMVNLGEFTEARAHLDAGLALDEPQQHHAYAQAMGQDAGVSLRCFGAWAVWSLGEVARAQQHLVEARARARAFNDPHSYAFAAFFTAFVHQLQGEAAATRQWAEETKRVADERGFPQWQAFGRILRGWAVAQEGARAAGIAELREGLAAYRAIGAELSRPHFLGLLAAALGAEGERDQALETLREARAESQSTGGRYYEAELLRLEGELRAPLDPQQARSCLLSAISLARAQGACTFELRAAVALNRMEAGSEAMEESRRALEEVVARCQQHDSPELSEARRLLRG